MCSPRAVDCTTASYFLRLLLRAKSLQFTFLQDYILGNVVIITISAWSCYAGDCTGPEPLSQSCLDLPENLADHSPHWATISLLLLLLQHQLKLAQDNLLAASVQNPLYGVMQCIRAALEEAKER